MKILHWEVAGTVNWEKVILIILEILWNYYGLCCYVMWDLFTVGSLQFPNDSAIASLDANQKGGDRNFEDHVQNAS